MIRTQILKRSKVFPPVKPHTANQQRSKRDMLKQDVRFVQQKAVDFKKQATNFVPGALTANQYIDQWALGIQQETKVLPIFRQSPDLLASYNRQTVQAQGKVKNDHFQKVLRGVDCAIPNVKFSAQSVEPPTMALASLSREQAHNEMQNMCQIKIAARKDPRLIRLKDQSHTGSYEQGVRLFKKRLRYYIRSKMRAKGQTTTIKSIYLEKLKEFKIKPTASDQESSDDEMRQLDRAILEIQQGKRDQGKSKLKEKLEKLGRDDICDNVDSLIESAYHSEKRLAWGQVKRNGLATFAPPPSYQTLNDFPVHHSSDSHNLDSSDELSDDSFAKQHVEEFLEDKNSELSRMPVSVFTDNQMANYGIQMVALSQRPPEEIILKILSLAQKKNISEREMKSIYKTICAFMNVPPFEMFKSFNSKEQKFQLIKSAITQEQAIPIAYTLPFLKLKSVTINDCNLGRKCSAILMISLLGQDSRVRQLEFDGVELSVDMIRTLDTFVAANPIRLEKLSFAHVKGIAHLIDLVKAIKNCSNLQYLCLKENILDRSVVQEFSKLIHRSRSIVYLDLSKCRLRGSLLEKLLDSLMGNCALQNLNLSGNSFHSADYVLASKMGRLVAGHPRLLHLDLSDCGLRREEVIYVAWSLRDSPNMMSLHLTGNVLPHQDRILIRALLAARARWPCPPPAVQQFKKISSADQRILVMLNICVLAQVTEPNFHEFGMSPITSLAELRGRISSFVKRRNINHQSKYSSSYEAGLASTFESNELLQRQLLTMGEESQRIAKLEVIRPNKGSMLEPGLRRSQAPGFSSFQMIDQDILFDVERYFDSAETRSYDPFWLIDFYGWKRFQLEHGKKDVEALWDKVQVQRLQNRQKQEKNETQSQTQSQNLSGLQNTPQAGQQIINQVAKRVGSNQDQMTPNKNKDQNLVGNQLTILEKILNLPVDSLQEVGSYANPMEGHAKSLILSRVLNHSELPENGKWFDCHECHICDRWSVQKVEVTLADRLIDHEFEEVMYLSTYLVRSRMQRAEESKLLPKSKNLQKIRENKLENALQSDSQDDSNTSSSSQVSSDETEKNSQTNEFTSELDLKRRGERARLRKDRTHRQQQKQTNLIHLQAAQGVIPIAQKKLFSDSVKVELRMKDQESNLTLFDSNLAAKPIQLKNIPQVLNPHMQFPTEKELLRAAKKGYSFKYKGGVCYLGMVPDLQPDSGGVRDEQQPEEQQQDQNDFKEVQRGEEALQVIQTDLPDASASIRIKTTLKKWKNRTQDYSLDIYKSRKVDRRPDGYPVNGIRSLMTTTATKVRDDGRSQELGAGQDRGFAGSYKTQLDPEPETYKQYWQMLSDQPENDEVYLIASFNHWLPIKMDFDKPPVARQNTTASGTQSPGTLGQNVPETSGSRLTTKSVHFSQGSKYNNEDSRLAKTDPETNSNRNEDSSSQLGTEGKKAVVIQQLPEAPKQREQLYFSEWSDLQQTKEPHDKKYLYHVCKLLQPGKHYFYFVKGGKYFMLSQHYQVDAYKDTNVRMNYIEIRPRTNDWKIAHQFAEPLPDESSEDEGEFKKERSCFKSFKQDSKVSLNKCLNKDFNLSKIGKIIKDQTDSDRVKETLGKHYDKLKNLFLEMSVHGIMYPSIDPPEINQLAVNSNFYDAIFNNVAFQNCVIAATVRTDATKSLDAHAGAILRFEFLELIVRVAQTKYKATIMNADAKPRDDKIYLHQAVEKLLQEHIFVKENEVADTKAFRVDHLYTVKVDKILSENETTLRKIMEPFNIGGKLLISLDEARKLLIEVGGIFWLDHRSFVKMFGYSQQTPIDLEKSFKDQHLMDYVEFLEFLGRVAHAAFEPHKEYRQQPLWFKIDGLLTRLARKLQIQKQFTLLPERKQAILDEVGEKLSLNRKTRRRQDLSELSKPDQDGD